MRITHINKYYPPHIGGIEFHLRDLAEELAARGHEVRAIVSNEGPDRMEEDLHGVHVTRLPRAFAAASTPFARGMSSAIREEARRADAPDVLHLHFPYPWGDLSWLRAHAGVPTVLSYHSDIVRQKAALAAYAPLLRRVLQRVDLVITSSPNMVEYSPFLSTHAEKARVIPYGIHVEHFEPAPAVMKRAEELRAGHSRPIVLFVGRLVYYKGAHVLVRAIADVDADLVMVGKGPLEGELRAAAEARGIADRITWVPSADDAELRAWYRAADIFCLPSVARSEAFGLVQLEAHASGTPTVSTTLTTSVPFVNLDGVTGLTIPPEDPAALAAALRTLAGDPALRERFGAQALERVRRDFTVGRMVDDTEAVYAEAIERHAARSRGGAA